MLHMDDLHFVVANKKSQLKIKAWVGSSICNNGVAGKEADSLHKQMNFKLCFTWSHYPFGIICKLRVEQKTTPYTHTPRPEIEKLMNQSQWEENTIQEAKE